MLCFEPSFSKNETHVLQLIPYLQEPSREVFAIVHPLEVSNELLAGHLFPNVLKGMSEKHIIIFLLLSKMTGTSNIRLNASSCSPLSPRQAALRKHSRDYSQMSVLVCVELEKGTYFYTQRSTPPPPPKKPQLNIGGNEEDNGEALWYLHGALYPHVSRSSTTLWWKSSTWICCGAQENTWLDALSRPFS